jgi:hypothetical protein
VVIGVAAELLADELELLVELPVDAVATRLLAVVTFAAGAWA